MEQHIKLQVTLSTESTITEEQVVVKIMEALHSDANNDHIIICPVNEPAATPPVNGEGEQKLTNHAVYSGSSYIGGYHWFHTLFGKIRDIGVYMSQREVDPILRSKWGADIQAIYKDMSNWYTAMSEGTTPQPSPDKAEPAIDPVAFDIAMEEEMNKLPYTKHVDDGQFNDGQLAGFEKGAYWAKQFLQQTKQQ